MHARVSTYEGDVDRLIEGFERQADLVRAAHLREEASEAAAATVGSADSYEVAFEVAGRAGD